MPKPTKISYKFNPFLHLNSDLLKMWGATVVRQEENVGFIDNSKYNNKLEIEKRVDETEKRINELEKDSWEDEIGRNVRYSLKKKLNADRIEERLYRTLLNSERYEKDVRPSIHHTMVTNVTFGFLLNQIVEMDERNQVLTTRCWLNINWFDPRLTWNQSEWGGIDNLYIPHHKLWKPDIMLINNAVTEYFGSLVSTDVMTTSKGNVTWLFSGLLKSVFHLNVKYYPFDDQECELRFASWSHHLSEMDLRLITNQGDLSFYMNNSEFSLINMKAYREVLHFPTRKNISWPTIVIKIKINRRPLFYVFNHVLPCALISSMAVLGFFMPPETGEKINMCITTMLSMGVYLQSITELIPPTSEAVPLIGIYYLASLSIVCLATTVNVMTLNVHRSGSTNQGRSIPYWMHKFILVYLANCLFMTIHEPDTVALSKTANYTNKTIRRKSILKDLKKKKTLSDRDKKGNEECECQQRKVGEDCENLILGKKRTIGDIDKNNHVCTPLMNNHKNSINNYPIGLTSVYLSSDNIKSTNLDEMNDNERLRHKISFIEEVVQNGILPNLNIMVGSNNEKIFIKSLQRILKRIYRSLKQQDIRTEILDERNKIKWQWHQLASVVDRFLLIIFSIATISTIMIFLVLPATFGDSSIVSFLFK
uniref:Neur_chan_LBD domain-containing protein n=1 Tax=Parastrongyloides trichosuri TaxID=131310 RepID=A0A0N4ZT20_PARTI